MCYKLAQRANPPDGSPIVARFATTSRVRWFISKYYYRHVRDNRSFGESVRSETKVDVLIPAIHKDIATLPHVIDNLRIHLRHPVGRILVVAPPTPEIKAVCEDKRCEFIPEDSVLPITAHDIDYRVGGLDRSGWLLQQFLKWSGDVLCSEDYFLVLDADTVLIRPQIFEVDHKAVLLHSDEHHQPYFEVYGKLLGASPPTPLSFTSHQMLHSRARIAELKKIIEERHSMSWYVSILEAIDRSQVSAFSDYETYGQWMLQNHPDEVRREYWFNLSMRRSMLCEISRLKADLSNRYRSISFHSYFQ